MNRRTEEEVRTKLKGLYDRCAYAVYRLKGTYNDNDMKILLELQKKYSEDILYPQDPFILGCLKGSMMALNELTEFKNGKRKTKSDEAVYKLFLHEYMRICYMHYRKKWGYEGFNIQLTIMHMEQIDKLKKQKKRIYPRDEFDEGIMWGKMEALIWVMGYSDNINICQELEITE